LQVNGRVVGIGAGEGFPFDAVFEEVAFHGRVGLAGAGGDLAILRERAFHDLGEERGDVGVVDGGVDQVMGGLDPAGGLATETPGFDG
jgi:hypothetical protein